jgi:hypothetical protein
MKHEQVELIDGTWVPSFQCCAEAPKDHLNESTRCENALAACTTTLRYVETLDLTMVNCQLT